MTWITTKLLGIRDVEDEDDVRAPRRPTLQIKGATLTDDPANNRTVVEIVVEGLAEVTGQAPISVVNNPDAQHRRVQISNATTSAAGAMSAADKTKLDGIEAGAQVTNFARVAAALAAASAAIAVNAKKITGLADPSDAQDAATKAYVDAAVGGGGGAGLDADTAVLENASTALNANGVALLNLLASLLFKGAVSPILELEVSAAGADELTPVLKIGVNRSGAGDAGMGPEVLFYANNGSGTNVPIGRMSARVVDPTAGAHTAELVFWTMSAGGDLEAAVLSPTGALTATGALKSNAGLDRVTAGQLPIGGTATSLALTLAGALQAVLSAASFAWAEGISTPTITQATRTTDAATTELRITSQAPFASATGTNRNPGNLRLSVPSPASGGAEGYHFRSISGADVERVGRPNGTFETEYRYSNSAVVHRNNTVSGSTIEMFTGGLLVSANNVNLRDVTQVLVGRLVMSSALLTLTADAATTTFGLRHTQRTGNGANAGASTSIEAQQGQNVASGTNNNGGDLNVASGAVGTGGSGGSAGSVNVRTGGLAGPTRIAVSGVDGSITESHGASAKFRREFGTAATRYTDHVSAVFTSNTSVDYESALSYTLPDNCAAVCVFWITAIDTVTGDVAGFGKRRVVKRWSGGGAVAVGSERDLGAADQDDLTWLVRTNVTGNTVYVEVDGDASNPVKWGIDAEIHITTTSA